MPKLKAIKGKLYVVEGDKVLEPFDFRGNYDVVPHDGQFKLVNKKDPAVYPETPKLRDRFK